MNRMMIEFYDTCVGRCTTTIAVVYMVNIYIYILVPDSC